MALVPFHDWRCDVELVARSVPADGVERRERLVAEFRAEARLDRVEGIERFAFVPDTPIMHVAPAVGMPAIGIIVVPAAGRAWPKQACRIAFADSFTDDAGVEPVIIYEVPVRIFLGRFVPMQRAEIFVVAAPQCEAGVVAQAFDLVPDFLSDVFQKVRRGRIERTREHAILPDEQSFFVAQIVKLVALILATAPDAEHVHVCLLCACQQILKHRARLALRQSRQPRVGVDRKARRGGFPPRAGRRLQLLLTGTR